jgi:hypothetical protein
MTGSAVRLRPVLAVGIVLVGYSFLAALWVTRHGTTPAALLLVREWINGPLGVGEDFGVLGVALLLVVAGYRTAQWWRRDGLGHLLRVTAVSAGLPLLLLVAAHVAIAGAGAQPLTEVDTGRLSVVTMVAGASNAPGLAWVGLTGALFVLLFAVSAAVAGRRYWLGCLLHLAAVAALVVTGVNAAGWYHGAGMLASFVTMPVAGWLIWAVRTGRVTGWTGGSLAAGCFAVLVFAESGYPELTGWWYPLTWLYAAGFVLLATTRALPCPGVVRWLATRAVALSATLGVLGYATLNLLYLRIALSMAFAAALVVTGLAAEALHRLCRAVLSRVRPVREGVP